MDRELFVQNVKYFCQEKGVAPTVAFRESGAGRSLFTNIAKGQTPSVEKVQQLAAYLGVTTSELLGEAPPGAGPGSALTSEALRVAEAFDSAGEKEKAIVRAALEMG